MMQRRPAEGFPPGDYLRDELEARGWSQIDFAEIIGKSPGLVNEIIVGKRSITPGTARAFAAALGTSPELWLNLESAYQLSRVHDDKGDAISRRARIFAKIPVKEMERRGWIEPSESVDVLEARVLQFLEIDDLDDEPDLLRGVAARKSTDYCEPFTPSQLVWLMRARQLARGVSAAPYEAGSVQRAIDRLKLVAHEPEEIRHVPRILAEAGIRFVVVQPLSGSKIDGACFWLSGSPVVAVTLRFDRIDNFWFVLMHELGHVDQGEASVDMDMESAESGQKADKERAANEFAHEHLVPVAKLDNFVARVRPLYSIDRITGFARTMRVHPGVVIGQLQYRKEVPYSRFRKLIVPIRHYVTAAALTDGWGAELPADL